MWKKLSVTKSLLPCDLRIDIERTYSLFFSRSFSLTSYHQTRAKKTHRQNNAQENVTVRPAIVDLNYNDKLENAQTLRSSHNFSLSELNEKINDLTKDLNVITQKLESYSEEKDDVDSKLEGQGTPPSRRVTDIPCGGCGALLHCGNVTEPGYVDGEKLDSLVTEDQRDIKCQKCHKLQHQGVIIDIRATDDKFKEMMRKITAKKCLVLLVIDLFDIENSIPDVLPAMLPKRLPVYLIGNKVDIIPQDQPHYLDSVEQTFIDSCRRRGLEKHNVKHVSLISAKTGYGVENLITTLLDQWGMSGDLCMIGTANSGKSTLYNALINSDFCNHRVRDVISKATVSVLPGTTINILKFPIMNAKTNWLMKLRQKRLLETQAKQILHHKKMKDGIKKSKSLMVSSLITTLQEKVEKTDFEDDAEKRALYSGFDLTAYEYGKGRVQTNDGKEFIKERPEMYEEENYKNSRFLYDTPGLLCDSQIHTILYPEELQLILPQKKIVPHCYLLKPDHVVFIAGLGRIDYVEGNQDVMLVIYISSKLPVHVIPRTKAEEFYNSNVGTNVLKVPIGDESRLAKLPPLKSKEIRIHLLDHPQQLAAADVQLSSLGWVSVLGMIHKPEIEIDVTLNVYTPGAQGIYQRPPMLKKGHAFHRKRVGSSFKYSRNRPKLLLMKGEQF